MEHHRLNFGCGHVILSDWTNFDVDESIGAGVVTPRYDRREMPQHTYEIKRHGRIYERVEPGFLPFESGTFYYAVANHSLCAIPHREVPHWLAELRRVLSPGGRLRILVPDLIGAFHAYERWEIDWFPNKAASVDDAFVAYLTWFSENRSCFTKLSLNALLIEAGFRPETPALDGPMTEIDSRDSESLIVQAVVDGT